MNSKGISDAIDICSAHVPASRNRSFSIPEPCVKPRQHRDSGARNRCPTETSTGSSGAERPPFLCSGQRMRQAPTHPHQRRTPSGGWASDAAHRATLRVSLQPPARRSRHRLGGERSGAAATALTAPSLPPAAQQRARDWARVINVVLGICALTHPARPPTAPRVVAKPNRRLLLCCYGTSSFVNTENSSS